jgi:mRNA interferase MazF
MSEILRGDIWIFNPEPIRGNEIGKKFRPTLVISNNVFNNGPAGLIVVVPLTTKNKKILCHVPIHPKDGGVKELSFAMCEQIRCISKNRLIEKWGHIRNQAVLYRVGEWISSLLSLDDYF